jgi:O-antigen/teichoic acid export membrane protein
VTDRRIAGVTPRRAATICVGAVIILLGHALGGFAGAAVVGAGIGVAIAGIGRREPHLLRRRDDGEPPSGDRWRAEW